MIPFLVVVETRHSYQIAAQKEKGSMEHRHDEYIAIINRAVNKRILYMLTSVTKQSRKTHSNDLLDDCTLCCAATILSA